MMQTGIWLIQFPNDGNRDGSRNVGLLTVQPSDPAALLRKLSFVYKKFTMMLTPLNIMSFTVSTSPMRPSSS